MKIGLLKEIGENEKRVALIPDSVKKLIKAGHSVVVESGAGLNSEHTDDDYKNAGAEIGDAYGADLIAKVAAPSGDEIGKMKEGTAIISYLYPLTAHDTVKKLADKKVNAFSLDMIPRTTLAQSMDVLSSMGTIAGYRAVLTGAQTLKKFFPMFMTAAGTVAPAKVLIIGCGVAGLQACATAKRLGATVEAFDQRPIVKDQVQSVGAKFIEVPTEEDAETEGGYAKELSEDYKAKQAELIKKHLAKADIVITTALIPGRPAPRIITKDMLALMKSGSVAVDIAAEFGGNVEGTVAGENVVVEGVTICGLTDIGSSLSTHASQMFSKNVENYLTHLVDKETQKLKYDSSDEITTGSLITKGGEIVCDRVKEAIK